MNKMNNKYSKVEVLKNYLNYVVEHKDGHCWNNTEKCHYGLLIKSINLEPLKDYTEERDADPFYDLVDEENELDGWYYYVFNLYKSNYCQVTNQPFTEVVNKLVSYGFTLDELANLEHLQDKRFIDIDINSNEVKDVNNLIQYLTNWIKYEEQLVKVTTKETVTVSCSK